jgi:anti-anti-sigma factor
MSKDQVLPLPFGVEIASVEGETVLSLRGELDLWTQPRLMAALAGLDDDVARVVLDLSDLTFIDCSNLRVIHRAQLLAGLRGTEFVLRSPNPEIVRIMELTGLPPVAVDENRSFVLPAQNANGSAYLAPPHASERSASAAVAESLAFARVTDE